MLKLIYSYLCQAMVSEAAVGMPTAKVRFVRKADLDGR